MRRAASCARNAVAIPTSSMLTRLRAGAFAFALSRSSSNSGMPEAAPRPVAQWLYLIHPEDRLRAAEAAAAAIRPGGPRYDVEYRVVRPDGTLRVVHSQGDVTWDDSGRALRKFGVLQDITELKQTEQ